MIRSIKIRNFKSLEEIDLTLSGFNLFIGTNSSGKSNFLDALRVLQGIGHGFTIGEILNGKPRTATTEVWEGIRGGAEFATFVPMTTKQEEERLVELEVRIEIKDAEIAYFDYGISFSATRGKVAAEWLSLPGRELFHSTKSGNEWSNPSLVVAYSRGTVGKQPHFHFDRTRPVLHQFADHSQCKAADRRILVACGEALSDVQRLDPSPEVLRAYSAAQEVDRMGERGENFAALVKTIISDPGEKQAYLEWLRELSPADVDDVIVLSGAVKEPLFAVKEGGKVFPAQVLSDGTLRFAAIAAAFFQKSMPSVLTLEEIEKGIHPNRLRLLVELLRSQTARLHNQVIATTHSPDVLSWLSEIDLQSTFVSVRNEFRGCSAIRALGGMEQVKTALRGNADISELFSEGWLESVS
jgi:energy-coupling factor transporter ATP-binding protein EcfA2